MKYLSFRSWRHRRAKVIQVPNIDFRLVSTRCDKICLEDTFLIFLNYPPKKLANADIVLQTHFTCLKWVDVQSSHWSCVLVTLSNDNVTLSSHDLRWIIQDNVAVLASGNEDARWVTACIHSIRTPDQFVVSVGSAYDEQTHSTERFNKECAQQFGGPMRGGEAAA